METTERRNKIMKALCRRRHDTIANLAAEFGVSIRTMRRDIDVLSYTEPIYTQKGRYGGGVYVVDSFNFSRIYMTDKESELMMKIYVIAENGEKCILTSDELKILKHIVFDYLKPSLEGKTYEKRREKII